MQNGRFEREYKKKCPPMRTLYKVRLATYTQLVTDVPVTCDILLHHVG